MPAILLGMATAALVVWPARIAMREHSRFDRLSRPARDPIERQLLLMTLLQKIGIRISRLPGLAWLPSSAAVHRAIGSAVVVCPPIAVRRPMQALVLAAAVIGVPIVRERQVVVRRRRAIARDMPMVIDLLHLGVRSGLTVGRSMEYVTRHLQSPVSDVFRIGLDRIERGHRMADVLEFLARELGVEGQSLTSALRSSERYGSPIGETLAQLAFETRQDQQQQSEQAARHLSVQLLFPLAGCILPAFALLTAAPLLAGSIGNLAVLFR